MRYSLRALVVATVAVPPIIAVIWFGAPELLLALFVLIVVATFAAVLGLIGGVAAALIVLPFWGVCKLVTLVRQPKAELLPVNEPRRAGG